MAVAAAAAMALVAMVAAATVLDLGLYTPVYLVTAIVEPGPLVESIQEAEAGFRFYLEVGGAAAGFAVHLGIGAGFGALFALLARALRLRGAVAVLVGAAYGLAVMALMGLVLIPTLAGETAGDQLIADARPDRLARGHRRPPGVRAGPGRLDRRGGPRPGPGRGPGP